MATLKPAARLPQSDGSPRAMVIATIIFNTVLLAFFLLFAWAQTGALIQMLRISLLLILVKSGLEIWYYVRTYTAPFARTSFHAWLIGLSGAVAPLLFRPNNVPDFYIGITIQVIGLALQIYLNVTINRAAEGTEAGNDVFQRGLFRVVRHPMSLAFLVSHFGYVASHTTLYNMGIFAVVTLLQVLRINEEERLLRGDEHFREYAYHTRWRVIPGMY